MIVDVHAHYVPKESVKVAEEIGRRYNLKAETDERGRELGAREGTFTDRHVSS